MLVGPASLLSEQRRIPAHILTSWPGTCLEPDPKDRASHLALLASVHMGPGTERLSIDGAEPSYCPRTGRGGPGEQGPELRPELGPEWAARPEAAVLGPPPCFCLCHISCFKAPFLGSLLLGPPVSPFASSHPCSLTGLWSPSPLCCPLGSLHHEPLLPTTFLLSSPFHPITQPSRLPLL